MQLQMEAREDVILELCALSGDFPTSLLGKLSGSYEWTKKTVRQLVNSKLIHRYQKDGIKSLRLTKKARDMLLDYNRERFELLLEGSGLVRAKQTNKLKRLRCHNLAGAYLMMMETGVSVYRDEKAEIFNLRPWDTLPLSVMEKWSVPCFYSSIEVKTKENEYIRIQNTRAAGVLFCNELDTYLVYNTGSSPLKWSEKSEQKLVGVVEGVLTSWKLPVSPTRGIMFGDDMETMLKLLTSDGGNRRQYYRVDYTFPAMHYIPVDENGKRLLCLICSKDAKRRISKRLGIGLEKPGRPIYAHDAMDGETSVLFAWDLDMVKIRSFKDGLALCRERGRVLCLDFQAGILTSYFGNLADIEPLNPETFWKGLLDGS